MGETKEALSHACRRAQEVFRGTLDDLEFTDRLAKGCRATGVDLLDHLILGSVRRWVSLRELMSW